MFIIGPSCLKIVRLCIFATCYLISTMSVSLIMMIETHRENPLYVCSSELESSTKYLRKSEIASKNPIMLGEIHWSAVNFHKVSSFITIVCLAKYGKIMKHRCVKRKANSRMHWLEYGDEYTSKNEELERSIPSKLSYPIAHKIRCFLKNDWTQNKHNTHHRLTVKKTKKSFKILRFLNLSLRIILLIFIKWTPMLWAYLRNEMSNKWTVWEMFSFSSIHLAF